MRLPSFGAIVLAVTVSSATAAEMASYSPAPGNEVVVYTHHFKPESFEAGVKLVEEGFTEAQSKLGQTRQNYFLVNSETHDVVVVSFFGEGMDVEEWHSFVGRLDVLKRLDPMRREPLEIERFTVGAITTAP